MPLNALLNTTKNTTRDQLDKAKKRGPEVYRTQQPCYFSNNPEPKTSKMNSTNCKQTEIAKTTEPSKTTSFPPVEWLLTHLKHKQTEETKEHLTNEKSLQKMFHSAQF